MAHSPPDVVVADSWRAVHPDARVGVVALRNVQNPARHDGLDARRHELEASLRARFAGRSRAELGELATIQPYRAFYRAFDKSYHVLLQLESVVLKARPLASGTALVQAMFMAELESQLLTAGHDLDAIVPPLTIAAARGDEGYTRLDGQPQTLKANDMSMADAEGVVSSVIYGPDRRTRITAATRNVVFVTYAPKGIDEDAVRRHLATLETYVRIVSPTAELLAAGVWGH
jgi:DNA/RNA-binding domain of Phe-tRNA-synthetase-like protein